MAGLGPRTSGPVWAERIATLDYKLWSGTANYAAAAAVTVTAPEYSCGACGSKLTLTSRQALTDALQDKNVDCRSCHATIEEQVAKILSPQSLEIRLRRTAEHDARQKATEAEASREQGQREIITIVTDPSRAAPIIYSAACHSRQRSVRSQFCMR